MRRMLCGIVLGATVLVSVVTPATAKPDTAAVVIHECVEGTGQGQQCAYRLPLPGERRKRQRVPGRPA